MRILLAPMEGLLDHLLREILTEIGGIDLCVSEFVRVSGTLLPNRVFQRIVPELNQGGKTRAGVPVRAQLMGSDPVCLAENAAKLAALGPAGIDLNFGCPAKCVNRHRGGAVLLNEPELLHAIVAAVRAAVPLSLPVTAKMRLGVDDAARAVDSALALVAGGAEELAVHGRTKADGYKPPAYWDRIGRIREAVSVPVIANGEIWTPEDAVRCQAESGCADLMLGRGMVAAPDLALRLRSAELGRLDWSALLPRLQAYWEATARVVSPQHRAGRLKQWLGYLRKTYAQADALFLQLRTLNTPAELDRVLAQPLDERVPTRKIA